MRGLDFSSWQSLLTTLLALALVTLIGVGFRLLAMSTIQQRRERANRQINERLRLLIAAYKTLGGSFTGDLAVDPTHLRDLLKRSRETGAEFAEAGSDRARRMRDAVEAALSDIILLGTEEHVRLAEKAARELVSGKPVHTDALVISLRDFIRQALDLDPIPADVKIPMQGPARVVAGAGGKGRGAGGEESGGGGKGGAGLAMGMGGMGMGVGSLGGLDDDSHAEDRKSM